jgi:hypothetical protein
MTAAFGDGASPEELTYRTIVASVSQMQPRALTPGALDNAVTLVEFMRDEAIRRHADNVERAAALDLRELALDKRARDLKIHERAVAAVLKHNAPRRLSNLWR